jgi:hypothetical protein
MIPGEDRIQITIEAARAECDGCQLPAECSSCGRWVCPKCERVRPWDDGVDELALCCDCLVATGYHIDIADEDEDEQMSDAIDDVLREENANKPKLSPDEVAHREWVAEQELADLELREERRHAVKMARAARPGVEVPEVVMMVLIAIALSTLAGIELGETRGEVACLRGSE